MPQALRDMPQLTIPQRLHYEAFEALASSRGVSMSGPTSIPMSEFRAYCDLFKVHDVEHIEALWRHIRNLDNVYLEYVAEQSKTK